MAAQHIAINGKFLSASPTGVHRVAEELILALDAELEDDPALRARYAFTIVRPRDATRTLPLRHIGDECGGLFTWQPWEQFDLPRLARGRLLVNLCNLGPIATRRAVTMIHDAQVYLSPASYGRLFRSWYRFVTPQLGRRHARILTVSAYSQDQLARFGVASADKITVIHNGVDHVARIDAEAENDAPILERLGLADRPFALALSTTQAHKNIKVLFEAFAQDAMADMRLVLFGGADRQAFEAADLPPPETVIFAGRVSDPELVSLMRAATALAFPSTTEGFGLPPGEAMALGCPVVAAPCGALPEVCADAALYAEPDAPDAWASALLTLADDPALRADLAERGRAQAARFTWRAGARRLIDILNDVTAATV